VAWEPEEPITALASSGTRTWALLSSSGILGYTVVGKVPGTGLRNRTLASIGIGKQLSDAISINSFLDWRRSSFIGTPDPADLVGVLSYRVGSTTISPNAFVGLTDGSSDFGLGIQIRYRFGRF
jgi:hypothetical protein